MTKIEQRTKRMHRNSTHCTVLIFSDIVRIAINMLQYSTTNVGKIEEYSICNLYIENTASEFF